MMKERKNILVAFLLNLLFSLFEIVGGIFTGSVAIISDALHDMGDACSIGVSYILEKKSARQPNDKYTYGYGRYSVLGGIITMCILLVGSVLVVYNAVLRWINPVEIHYDGMIIFAVVGLVVNGIATYVTRDGNSLNQKAVNLHMLEDVLGWAVVLVGAIVMRFTGLVWLDPLLSIAVAVFIFWHAISGMKEALDLFLVKTPNDVSVEEIKTIVLEVEGVCDVHHIHLWSINGNDKYATMHLVVQGDFAHVKHQVKQHLQQHDVHHTTLELESLEEHCEQRDCVVEDHAHEHGHCHHHHHHHH